MATGARDERKMKMLAEIFGLDGVVVLVVVLAVLFGGSQIPKLARSLGSAKKEFKQGQEETASEHAPSATPHS
jgi:sec-independent protein translocase protein TatA